MRRSIDLFPVKRQGERHSLFVKIQDAERQSTSNVVRKIGIEIVNGHGQTNLISRVYGTFQIGWNLN